MKVLVDCRYVTPGRHNGISRYTAGLVTALLLLGRALLRRASGVARIRVRPSGDVIVPAGVAPALVRPLARAAAGRAPPRRLSVG